MSRPLRLSQKHGVNPAIPHCYFCGEAKNEVILAGLLPNDAEAPRAAVWDKRPCDRCAEHMRQGVMLIKVRDGEEHDNPHRLGSLVVVKDHVLDAIITNPDLLAHVKHARVAFVPETVWTHLGFDQAAAGQEPSHAE